MYNNVASKSYNALIKLDSNLQQKALCSKYSLYVTNIHVIIIIIYIHVTVSQFINIFNSIFMENYEQALQNMCSAYVTSDSLWCHVSYLYVLYQLSCWNTSWLGLFIKQHGRICWIILWKMSESTSCVQCIFWFKCWTGHRTCSQSAVCSTMNKME